MSSSITTVKTSDNEGEYSSLQSKFNDFFSTLSRSEKGILERKVNYFSNLSKKNQDLQISLDETKKELSNSLNEQYRNLTIMIGEGVIITILFYMAYKFFHQNKLYQKAEETLPEAQKTVLLKKVVRTLHELEKKEPKSNTISLLTDQMYNEQLAPEDAIFKDNYDIFTKETNKYTDKLNTMYKGLDECHKLSPANREDCLKDIFDILPKEPVQSFFKSKKQM